MRLQRRLVIVSILLALAVAALAWVTFRTEPLPVDLHEVAVGPLQVTIEADGETRIREIYEIAAPIAGTALRAPVEAGDAVIAGETVLAVVEPVVPALLDARSRIQAEAAVREAEAALQVAASDIRKAEEDLAHARSQYERARRLAEGGTVSLTHLEDAAQRLAVAEAARAAALSRQRMAESSLDRARAALIAPEEAAAEAGACCIRLTAPVDGVVLAVPTESERPVAAGTALVSVGDPSDMEIVADLLSNDAVRLAPGARAIVERWGGAEPLEARLTAIDPVARTRISALGIEEQRVAAHFDLVTPLRDRAALGHGYAVFLRIVEWEDPGTLQVPLGAVFRDGSAWAVFVVENGVARIREVALGRRSHAAVQVLGGLAPGEVVILHPGDQVAEGMPVVARGG